MPHLVRPQGRIHLTTEHTEEHGKNEDLENPSFDLSLGIDWLSLFRVSPCFPCFSVLSVVEHVGDQGAHTGQAYSMASG